MKLSVHYLFLFLSLINCKEKQETNPDAANLSVRVPYQVMDFEQLDAYMDASDAQVTIVNFWATWCKPCVKELPYFEQLGMMYKEDGVKVILVSLDFPDQLKRLESFIEKRNLKSEIIYLDDSDANTWIPIVDKTWSGAIPATILMNKNKRKFFEGSLTYDQLETEIKSLL